MHEAENLRRELGRGTRHLSRHSGRARGIGLRAEPHFLYAALEGVVERMNEHRLDSLTIPVLGAGHGGLPLPIAILLNLLAVRSITAEDRRVRRVRLVVFEGNARDLPGTTLQDVVRHVATLAQGAG